jgi:hypothetical protein
VVPIIYLDLEMQSKFHHVILCSRHLISSLLENCSVLDLLTPVFPQRFLVLASLGYLLQAMGRGLAAPSNQVVHTHFAISENVGDVLAKEEVWTVAAELCGLALGVCILAAPGMMTYWKLALTWLVLRIVHLYIRYMCLATLRLYTVSYIMPIISYWSFSVH